jgi:hypothetical protein
MICATELPDELTLIFKKKLELIFYFSQYVRNTFQPDKYLTSYAGDKRKTRVGLHI